GKWHSFILLGVLDVSANLFELTFRTELNLGEFFPMMYLLAVVAIVRSTLVGLAFTAWRQHERILLQQQERREFERILLVTSDVSGELLYLESTLAGLEKIMLKSYQLYSRLKQDNREGGEVALAISRDVHDAKKDFERLAARLRQVLIRQKEGESVDLTTLIDIAVRANRDFARELNKQIEFNADVESNVDVASYHIVLSIINNLVGNAIEASGEYGEIHLQVDARHQRLLVVVSDTGSGIKSADLPVIFTPGYTTKFDPATGKASTGLGLAQVKHIVEELGGEIQVESREGVGSRFAVNIPFRGRP
ncbi:MAG TPA: ATP-binding protein, partial [Bacillota bacterium]|nr:ATP-binding protein [Bacillota bacterium]